MNKRLTYIIITALALISFTATAQVQVHGNVYGGGNLANVAGSSTVTINVTAPSNGYNVDGDVYGGGALADVNVTNGALTPGKTTSVTLTSGIVNNVYGGGLGQKNGVGGATSNIEAKVFGPVQVTINGGTVNQSVYGCNNIYGAPKSTVKVDINKGSNAMTVHNVYGGGNLAAYSAPTATLDYPEVNIKHGTVLGSVFGGGYGSTAEVTGNPQVNIGDDNNEHTAIVTNNVYGGGDLAAVTGSPVVTVQNANSKVSQSVATTEDGGVFGGGNKADVSGSTTVHIHAGTIYKDVYGGGALAHVGTNASDNTIVNVTGGTVNGNVYGGGLGRKASEGVTAIAAAVNSTVTVNIGAAPVAPATEPTGTATIGGSVFGCNNANGTPKDNVTVNIYKTAHDTYNTASYVGTQADPATFAIAQVFGGGNQAHYQPTSTGKKATVHIWTCDNTIEYVYGGGNAANVGTDGEGEIKSATDVIIDGGRIEWVFGGGNGKSTPTFTNPGANIYGNTKVTYHAGNLTYIFGGSNEKGNVSGNKTLDILNDGTCTYNNHIAELYGGSNMAPTDGDVSLTMGCPDNPLEIGALFGGSRNADIFGDVTLTVEGGQYDKVFGGNNIGGTITGNVTLNLYGGTINNAYGGNNESGAINGKITVNVLDDESMNGTTPTCPLVLHNVYGGGFDAPYNPSPAGAYPEVNIIHGTVSKKTEAPEGTTGNVFGGGYGATAVVKSNPNVTVGYGTGMTIPTTHPKYNNTDQLQAVVENNMFGGGDLAAVAGATSVTLQHDNSSVANLFGGGNQASVGNATVNVAGGAVSTGVYGGCNTSGSVGGNITPYTATLNTTTNEYENNAATAITYDGDVIVGVTNGTIGGATRANIHGGGYGHQTETTGNVTVTFGAQSTTHSNLPTLTGDLYGGSALGNVGTSSSTTTVNIINGKIIGDVYGGGLGSTSPNYAAAVNGNVFVNIGKTIESILYNTAVFETYDTDKGGNVFGCNNAKGAPTGTVQVNINGNVAQNVYGGGNLATSTVTPDVNIISGTVSGSVFGGGNQAGVGGGDVVMTGGTVSGGLYGGCNTSGTVTGEITVSVTNGTVGANDASSDDGVFGGGYGSGTNTNGDVTVNINGADVHVYGDVYGGSAKGHVNDAAGDKTNVTLTAGTIHGDLYGGGLGDNTNAATVSGAVKVDVNGGTVTNVFGCNNVNGAPQSTVQVDINETTANTMNVTNVFGGGNLATYSGNPAVNIINGTVSGNVFGGGKGELVDGAQRGQKGKVIGAPQVTVGDNNNGHTAHVTGDVYGGGDAANVDGTPVVVVNDCNTTIGDLYGGGNAADVTGTNVTVNGGTINLAFGGGHGDKNASNPSKYADVNGNVSFNVVGGTIAKVFAGSNSRGSITGTSLLLNIDKSTAANACDMFIGEVYGGGNEAAGKAASISIGCTGALVDGANGHIAKPENIGTTLEGIGKVFGGANQANVTGGGKITLDITSGIVHQVFGGNNTSGEISGDIEVNIDKTGNACGWYVGDVFGGGDHAWYGGKPDVNIKNGTVYGYVYGGGNDITETGKGVNESDVEVSGGIVLGGVYGGCNENGTVVTKSKVVISSSATVGQSGTPANVYGGGLGENTKVKGDVDVTVDGASVNIYGDVYGGSAKGLVNCNDEGTAQNGNSKTDVTLTNGTITGNIYGGGHGLDSKDAHVWGPITVTVNNGSVNNVFGGNNLKGTPKSSVLVDIKGGVVNQDVYGGGNLADVDVATQVTIEGGTPKGNVYGGGAFASTGATTVNILDGTIGTSGNANTGNVYGGGLGGQLNSVTYEPAINGVVTVNIGAPEGNINTLQAHSGNATILGSVYGCNNTAGSPQDNVFVNIYGTAPVTEPAYAIANVFGGGNLADYNANGKTAKVMVYGCANAIKRVFGGGNAAAAPHVETVIQGGRFDYVFGGGNGESGTAANITAGVNLAIHGGTVNHYFAGSNMTGSVSGGTSLTVDNDGPCGSLTIDEFFCGGNYAPIVGDVETVIACGSTLANVNINNLYGGCNMADITGNVLLTVRGGKYLNIFGGSKGLINGNPDDEAADISGNVTLNIYGGTVGYIENNTLYEGNIFGGSNYNGSIGGLITVNVEDQGGTCALDIEHANVFGGGNIAVYMGTPQVNIKHCTVKNVYGGGNGDLADNTQTKGSTGATTVNLGDNETGHTVTVLGNVYGGGNAAKVNGATTVLMQNANTTVNKVFGGGNQADVTSNATVTVNKGTINGGDDATHNGVYGGCNDKGNVGGLITLNINDGTFGTNTTDKQVFVHGGGYGQHTTTSGSIEVNIGNGSATPTIYGDVYGGSALGKVNSSTSTVNTTDHTYVNLVKGTINGSLYGGGLGDNTYAADVYSPVTVTITKGTVTGAVYGCNNINGSPKSTVAVTVNGTDAVTNGYAIKGVYGGGNQAHYIPTTIAKGYPLVIINGCNTSIEDVFGGGRAAAVSQTKVVINGGNINRAFAGGDGDNTANTPAHVGYKSKDATPAASTQYDTPSDANGVGDANINVNGGTITQVFGGTNKNGVILDEIKVGVEKSTANGACAMHITEVYGGGNEANSQAGNITVGCTGTFTSFDDFEGVENLYGGARKANITSGNIVLNVEKGNIKNVFGGNNVSGTISGTITVNIDQKDNCLHVNDVYGGGNEAYYDGTPQVNIKAGTISHDVYGGGNNITETDKGVGGTDVQMSGGTIKGDVYGGCNLKGTVLNNSSVKLTNGTVEGSVYGGGLGVNTVVVKKAVVDITGTGTSVVNDVYGGGNEGQVNQGTEVNIH